MNKKQEFLKMHQVQFRISTGVVLYEYSVTTKTIRSYIEPKDRNRKGLWTPHNLELQDAIEAWKWICQQMNTNDDGTPKKRF